jgi:hypothetical protein
MTESARIPRRAARFACVLLALLAGLEIFYILAVFIFLTSPIFGKVVHNHPHDMEITFSAGWSWLPGWVHLHGAVIAGEDPNVRWRIEIPSASCKISLRDLFERQVHLRDFQSPQGLTFELHLKSAAEKAAFPTQQESEILAQKKATRWRLIFDHVHIDRVGRLQIEDWVYRGGADIDGSFALWPGIEARVGPATLELKDGKLNNASQVATEPGLLERLNGHVMVQIENFSVPETSGSEVLKYVNADSAFTGNTRSVAWINRFVIRNPALSLEKGEGALSSHVLVRHGSLVSPSEVTLDTSEIVLVTDRLVARGKGQLRAEVQGDLASLALRLSDLKLESRETGYELASAQSLALSVFSANLDINGIFASRYFTFALPEARLSHEQDWIEYFATSPSAIKIRPGPGTLSLQLAARDGEVPRSIEESHRIRGAIALRLPQVSAKSGGASLGGDLFFRAQLGTVNMHTLHSKISGLAWGLSGVTGSFSRKSEKPVPATTIRDWWLHGKIDDFEIALTHGLRGEADSVVEIRNTEPLIGYYLMDHELSGVQKYMLQRGAVRITCHAAKDEKSIRLDPLTVKSGVVKVAGGIQWLGNSKYPQGSFALNLGPLSVGARFAVGKSEFRLFPTTKWLDPSTM